MKKEKPILSIIILSYNTETLLKNCLDSLQKVSKEINFETIVVDNFSQDNSVDVVKNKYKWVKLIESSANVGFSAGNNLAKSIARGKYVLFLNSDTIVHQNTLKETVEYMEKNIKVGAISCKAVLLNGKLDKDTRRSFPTPWVAFTHFTYLDRIFPTSKIFAKYWYGYVDENTEHEVDVLQGAFFLSRKEILDKVGWFDERYFLNGEDIDLSWKIKNEGWKIIYYPKVSIIHIKKGSKNLAKKLSNQIVGVRAMELFYRNRLWKNYPWFINCLVIFAIRGMLITRSFVHLLKK